MKTSNVKNISYIGHSQGTMIMFAELSENPSMKQNIKSTHMLSPIISLSHQSSTLLNVLSFLKDIENPIFQLFNIYEFLGYGWVNSVATGVCSVPIINSIC